MAEKQRQEKEKAKEEKRETKYVRLETAAIIALVTFVLGFFTGEIVELSQSDRPTMAVQQSGRGQQPPQMPGQKSSMTPEQRRSNILALEKAVASDPGNVKAWNQLGHLYLESNQSRQGIKAFNKVVELNPNNAHAWTDLGIMYRKNKQPVEAIAAFDKALEIEPHSQESLYWRGAVSMWDLNDRESAIKAWEELLKLNPTAEVDTGQTLRDMVEELKKGD
jgi:cytochrome c-type biogenesis protein CcmH/NrfG